MKEKRELHVSKTGPNYYVLRTGNYVFTVYVSGHINITKLPDESHIDPVVSLVGNLVGLTSEEFTGTAYKIDNITASGRSNLFPTFIPLTRVIKLLWRDRDLHKIFSIKLRREKFPGCFIKFIYGGTIVLFISGKFVIVGIRHRDQIKALHNWLEITLWNYLS